MTPAEFKDKLAEIGMVGQIQTTGSPDWVRVFIQADGSQWGRANFHHDELWNIKWYHREDGELWEADFVHARINCLLNWGKELTKSDWADALNECKLRHEADKAKKKQARAEKDFNLRLLGKRIPKRPSIKGRSPRAYMSEVLEERFSV